MSGFLPRLFGKSQYQGETRRQMNEMQDLKTNQHIDKLESELKASKAKVEELQGKLEAMKIVLEKKDTALDDVTRDREKVALALKNEDLCNKYMKEQLEKGLKNLERNTRRFLIEKSNFQTKKDLLLGQITVKDPNQYPQSLEECILEKRSSKLFVATSSCVVHCFICYIFREDKHLHAFEECTILKGFKKFVSEFENLGTES